MKEKGYIDTHTHTGREIHTQGERDTHTEGERDHTHTQRVKETGGEGRGRRESV